ncbi:MAG: metallophosphoesterase family protein [Planctomycetota bacterium]
MPPGRRIGILADIHSNLAALDVALHFFDRVGVDGIFQLGDLVGYAGKPRSALDRIRGQPREVIERIQAREDVISIQGNHDRALTGEIDPSMRKAAREVLAWTREQLSAEQVEFLRTLPEGRSVDDQFLLVHGSILERDAYILSATEVKRNLAWIVERQPGPRICFFGHTHIPMLIGTKHIFTDLKETKTFQLDRDDVYLLNPGSVGQPRDKCPLAAFGVFDVQQWTMTFVREPYEPSAAPPERRGGFAGGWRERQRAEAAAERGTADAGFERAGMNLCACSRRRTPAICR